MVTNKKMLLETLLVEKNILLKCLRNMVIQLEREITLYAEEVAAVSAKETKDAKRAKEIQ